MENPIEEKEMPDRPFPNQEQIGTDDLEKNQVLINSKVESVSLRTPTCEIALSSGLESIESLCTYALWLIENTKQTNNERKYIG